jgi:hypothetical protein
VDLDLISQTVDEINPLLDQYIDIVGQTKSLIAQAQADLEKQLSMLQLAVTALFTWLGLNQFVPLYLGWTLLTGHDEDEGRRPGATKAISEAAESDRAEHKGEEDVRGEDETMADEST